MKLQKYFAELIGTFGLAFAVNLSITNGVSLAPPLVAGLTLGLFVYTIGGISGAHLNPAVTIGMASIKKISIKDALFYVISQFIGAFLAMLVAENLLEKETGLVAVDSLKIGIAEAIGAFILAFGVAAVTYKKVDDDASGVVVGGSLALGAMLAGTISNGVINPAVALGVNSVSWVYIFAPVVGAIVSALVFRYILQNKIVD